MTDVMNYCPDEASTLELIGIDGAPMMNQDGSPMTISLLGEDSDVAVAFDNDLTNRRIQQAQRGGQITAEAITGEMAAKLAKLTTGWNISFGGEVAVFSEAAARKLYADRKMSFIVEQVQAFVKARRHFLKPSKAS